MRKIRQSRRKPGNRPTAKAAGRERTQPPPDPPPTTGPPPTEEPLSLRRVLRCLRGRSVLRCVDSFVRWVEPYSILAAVLGLFVSFLAFRSDLEDRMEERSVEAWQLLTTKASGNSGKREALEYLNKTRTPLVGIDLSAPEKKQFGFTVLAAGAYLVNVQLPFADLSLADLTGPI